MSWVLKLFFSEKSAERRPAVKFTERRVTVTVWQILTPVECRHLQPSFIHSHTETWQPQFYTDDWWARAGKLRLEATLCGASVVVVEGEESVSALIGGCAGNLAALESHAQLLGHCFYHHHPQFESRSGPPRPLLSDLFVLMWVFSLICLCLCKW